MQIRNLISLLEGIDPDKEISVTIRSIETGHQMAVTYDIGYEINESGEIALRITV